MKGDKIPRASRGSLHFRELHSQLFSRLMSHSTMTTMFAMERIHARLHDTLSGRCDSHGTLGTSGEGWRRSHTL